MKWRCGHASNSELFEQQRKMKNRGGNYVLLEMLNIDEEGKYLLYFGDLFNVTLNLGRLNVFQHCEELLLL